jgi:hypothetical protein
MSAYLDTNLVDIMPPAFVGLNDTSAIRIAVMTSITLADLTVYVIDPRGQVLDITSGFVSLAGVPWNYLLSQDFNFRMPGLYTFSVYRSTSGSEGRWNASAFCAEWASRIDVPVSQLSKQRSDIQRVYSRVNSK